MDPFETVIKMQNFAYNFMWVLDTPLFQSSVSSGCGPRSLLREAIFPLLFA